MIGDMTKRTRARAELASFSPVTWCMPIPMTMEMVMIMIMIMIAGKRVKGDAR